MCLLLFCFQWGSIVLHLCPLLCRHAHTHTHFALRITHLHDTIRPGQTIDKTLVHGEAWLCKKFCVLVKRKLSRGQYCRDPRFRALLQELSPPEDILFFKKMEIKFVQL